MNAPGRDNGHDGHVIIDLPIRLRPEELAGLNAMAAETLIVRVLLSVGPEATAIPEETVKQDKTKVDAARDHAKGIIDLRRKRERIFEDDLFADPCWDILLDLFVRQVDRRTTSVSSACLGARVPATTALRHLKLLVERGLVTKRSCAADQRVYYVELSESCYIQMLSVLQTEDTA